MGKVDTALRFGQYNSYELDAGEELWTSKFEVEFYSEIAIQIQAIQPDGAVTGEIIVRWIGADGGMLHDTAKAFTPAARWTKQVYVVDVPVGAKHAMWAVKNTHGSNKLNFACGMAEPGPVAGAFDPALANMVSLMDAHGLYTGTVTANQVQTGQLEGFKGLGGFDLDEPRIWMKSADGAVTWEATPENPILVKKGNDPLLSIEGGDLTMAGKIISAAGNIGGFDISPNGLIATITHEFGPFTQADVQAIMDIFSASSPPTAAQLKKYDINRDGWIDGIDATFASYMVNGTRPNPWAVQFVLELNTGDSTNMIKISSPDLPTRNPTILGLGRIETETLFSSSNTGLKIEATGDIDIASGDEITISKGQNALGLDATGPYFVKNGVKTYL